jgi:hypothetical protein
MMDLQRPAAVGRAKRGIWTMAVALALVVVGVLAVPVAAQAENTWQREIVGHTETSLHESQCFSVPVCISVGTLILPGGGEHGYANLPGFGDSYRTPAPNKSISSNLEDLSCTDSTHCTVVGSYRNSGGTELALALKRNESNWSVHTVPVPEGAKSSRLEGVSCASSSFCVAAGSYVDSEGVRKPMLDSWNGSKWSAVTIAAPEGAKSSELHDVTCPSSALCAAVGQYTNSEGESPALIEVWNGTTWSQSESVLYGVETTVEDLQSVACYSTKSCVAVGSYEDAEGKSQGLSVTGSPEGAVWTESEVPIEAEAETELRAVSCATLTCFSAGTVRKGGTSYPIVSAWLIWEWTGPGAMTPEHAGVADYEFSGIGCASSSYCEAVGSATGEAEGDHKQLLGAASWGEEMSTAVGGSTPERLEGVSCPASSEETWCMAVGSRRSETGEGNVSWILNGEGGWEEEPISNLNANLADVDCSESSGCTAVGYSGESELVVKRWNGGSWGSQTPASIEGEVEQVYPQAVSCPGESDCVMVGYYEASFPSYYPLVQRWNGSSWSMLSVPKTLGGGPVFLTDVSCSSSSNCVAAGLANGSPAIERWNGSTWTAEFVPMPAESSGGSLAGVSCTSSSACTVVGSYYKSGGTSKPMISRWNGSSWSLQTPPAEVGRLESVACASATECVAVAEGEPNTMIAWNGTTWAVEETKKAASEGARTGRGSVSCAAAESCVAVGSAFTWGIEDEPLAIRSE